MDTSHETQQIAEIDRLLGMLQKKMDNGFVLDAGLDLIRSCLQSRRDLLVQSMYYKKHDRPRK